MGRKQVAVNYLYFGIFFILLMITSTSSIFLKESTIGARFFFILYASGQTMLEMIFLIFMSWLTRQYLGIWPFYLFISTTFLLLFFHLIDFLMDRILDLSVWETLSFVCAESFTNFLLLLDASGVPLWLWIIAFSFLAALPCLGIAFHAWTERVVRNRPFHFHWERLLQTFLCIQVALFFWEFRASNTLHPDAYTALLQSLPWKWTFLHPKTVRLSLPNNLAAPIGEPQLEQLIAQDATILKEKPNIYLFVVESLREDIITEETAPNLSRFRNETNHFDLALSNGNGTHLSWFSIFHAQFPYCWKTVQTMGWDSGAPPLQLLKKWGYKIRLYTSAQLNYYGMEELLFGKKHSLIDSYQTFHHSASLCAAETDAQALNALQRDLTEHPELREGQLIIIFWDSTHFNYSWPKEWLPRFTPICHGIDYFDIFQSKQKIAIIKNRYKNAVYYIDSLFGNFLQSMPDPERAIVLFTGDHGEEFFEHGHLFHGSHLIHEQTNIPIYMKFGTYKGQNTPRLVSQMDLFPSVLHYLSGRTIPFLEGSSIFAKNHWPYAVIARFNAGRSPYEFCIHNGESKLIARFDQRQNIFNSEAIQIRSLWDRKDRCLFQCKNEIPIWIQMEFGSAIDRLFTAQRASTNR